MKILEQVNAANQQLLSEEAGLGHPSSLLSLSCLLNKKEQDKKDQGGKIAP